MGSLAKAEALAASLRVRLFQVEGAVLAVVARRSVNVFLAMALGGLLVANLRGRSSQVAVALVAIRERI